MPLEGLPVGSAKPQQPLRRRPDDGDLPRAEGMRRDRAEVRDHAQAGQYIDAVPDAVVGLPESEDEV